MFVSEDGTVTGSIDVSKLDEVEPKTDEAKAQLEQLKGEAKAAQEQAARDAERVAEQSAAQDAQLRGSPASDDASQQSDADAKQAEETQRLQAEAEAAGVTVDKRWGPDRLRQETEQAKAAKSQQKKG